jgi:2-polyprenyl-6-hydroxyphenyl methylase/3-demethylubiquinone-9 3-methyltransferase
MSADLRAARKAWGSFGAAGVTTRAFLAARLLVLPLSDLDRELRALRGRVLSLGAGYGILERYITEINLDVVIEGLEIDAARVRQTEAAGGLAERVIVREADVTLLDEDGSFDAAMAVDVLHHIPAASHSAMAEALLRALRPGGTCLVKDIATTPAWQYRWNVMHDRLVAGPEPINCRDPQEMAEIFEGAGFVCEDVRRIGRSTPYPHYLLVLRRP